jgi:hypothetical protein
MHGMNLDLSPEETAALLRELDHIIDGDRYPFSPRMQHVMSPYPATRFLD